MRLASLIRLGAVLCLGAGVVCQFVQHTDPVFPLTYFTVNSALLAAVSAAVGLRPGPETIRAAMVRGAATTGVIVSGIVYAAVMAPASPTGTWFQPWDDPWVRASTVLMHGVGPVFILADYLTHPSPVKASWRNATRWCAWPTFYLAVMLTLQGVGVVDIPYTFLQTTTVGGTVGVGAAAIGVAAVFIAAARIVQELRARLSHKSPGTHSDGTNRHRSTL